MLLPRLIDNYKTACLIGALTRALNNYLGSKKFFVLEVIYISYTNRFWEETSLKSTCE